MTPTPPPDIDELVRRRIEARARRDWAEADELRARIEAAGWKVIDVGAGSRLEPAHPPDVVAEGRVRYGASTSVPSLIGEAPTHAASVVLVATDRPEAVARALDGLLAHAPAATQVVVVANDPSGSQADALAALEGAAAEPGPMVPLEGAVAEPGPMVPQPEILWTSARLGHATALNCGLRRCAGATVLVLDPRTEPSGDIVSPVIAALEDASIAVTGTPGLVSDDLRRFQAAPAGDVDAIGRACQGFRRADYAARGPLDERFRLDASLDLWWSFVLRDEGTEQPPRRALALDLALDQPSESDERLGDATIPEHERTRLARRNFYRFIDRFGRRSDMLRGPEPRR